MSRCRKSIPWSLNTPIRLESQIKMKRGVCDFNGYTIIKLGRILHRVDTFHDVVHNAQFVRIQYFFHSVNQQNYCWLLISQTVDPFSARFVGRTFLRYYSIDQLSHNFFRREREVRDRATFLIIYDWDRVLSPPRSQPLSSRRCHWYSSDRTQQTYLECTSCLVRTVCLGSKVFQNFIVYNPLVLCPFD